VGTGLLSTDSATERGPSPFWLNLWKTRPSPYNARVRTLAVAAVLVAVAVGATRGAPDQETPDAAALTILTKIRDEGLHRSQVEPVFDMFVNVIGPRLTGSPAQKRAADYARGVMEKWGLGNPHLEPWLFGRGWSLEKLTIEMVEPRYAPLVGYAEAWTPSTNGEQIVNAVSVAGKPVEEIERMDLAGVAVLQQPPVTNFIVEDRPQPADLPDDAVYRTGAPPAGGARAGSPAAGGARQGAAAAGGTGGTAPSAQQRITAAIGKATVILKPSRGNYGTVFVQAGRNDPPATTPAIVLMGEHYDMIAQLLAHGIPVKLRVNVQSRFYDTDKNSYNVIADIPGSDPVLKDQLVMLGGHLDSWHAATGATDNADGAAAVMEALRILHAIGARPKRTIRVAVWSGEEEGLLGSKAYVADHLAGDAHKAERDRFDVYFNIDPGYGPIYGWYLENNDAVKPIFDAWLAPLKDLGMVKNVKPGIPSTDHLSFTALGLPGFNPIQSYKDYDTRLHHTNVDTAERITEADLEQNAIVLAWYVYQAAMRPDVIPSTGRH
jgi:carboxypeptidase Q